MDINAKELQEFINSSINALKNGTEGTGFEIVAPIKFKLAVINTAEGGGGLKIYVAKAEGKMKSEEISHIEFEVQPERKLMEQSPQRSKRRVNIGL